MRAWACKIGEKRGAVFLVAEILNYRDPAEKRIRFHQMHVVVVVEKTGRLENGRRGKNDGPFPCCEARKKTNSLIFCHSITAEIHAKLKFFCRIRVPPTPFPSTPL